MRSIWNKMIYFYAKNIFFYHSHFLVFFNLNVLMLRLQYKASWEDDVRPEVQHLHQFFLHLLASSFWRIVTSKSYQGSCMEGQEAYFSNINNPYFHMVGLEFNFSSSQYPEVNMGDKEAIFSNIRYRHYCIWLI